jgi:signal transduction histidine kinase
MSSAFVGTEATPVDGLAQPSLAPNFNNGSKKVLVIDDTAEIRMIITESLNIYGFATLAAEDGVRGIKVAQEQYPDLIICDINMPNLDGYGTLAALRENEATATIPFIFLTGAADKLNMRRGMEMGADDYLTKPFTHKELLAAVNTRLEKQADFQRHSEKKLDELRGNITLALPHELRTPLNGIMGLASLMMDDYATLPPEEVLESARYIHESALRLHRLIENFLVFSQLELMASEAKKIEAVKGAEPIAVNGLVSNLARTVAAKYKRDSDLVLEVGEANLLIPSDSLSKIVEELVDNAFKFSDKGKPVRVATERANGTFHVIIHDRGRGMAADQITKIGPHMQFDRKIFEQQGAGLGLIISKRMTELLGGQMSIASVPGRETRVQVSFNL